MDAALACFQNHDNCSREQGSPHTLMTFRLIDVYSKQVVPMNKEERYVAMSYVWGKTARYSHNGSSQSRGSWELPNLRLFPRPSKMLF